MKTRWFLAVLFLVLIINALWLSRSSWLPDRASVPDRVTPYTVTLQTVSYKLGQAPRVWWEETHATTASGSYVRRDQRLGDGPSTIAREIYMADGRTITVDDVRELKSTVVGSHAGAQVIRDPATGCLNTLIGTRRDRSETPAGEIRVKEIPTLILKSRVSTQMFAPDLGCALLYARRGDGPSFEAKEPLKVIQGEPDRALFDVPEHYREVSPSALGDIDPKSEDGQAVDRFYLKNAARQNNGQLPGRR